mgnify:CR=1 FL=1
MTVLKRPPTWEEAKKALGDPSFLTNLLKYDKDLLVWSGFPAYNFMHYTDKNNMLFLCLQANVFGSANSKYFLYENFYEMPYLKYVDDSPGWRCFEEN